MESGSGPGGRRFKSSLPDQFFQSDTNDFWSGAHSSVGDFVAARASEISKPPLSQMSAPFCGWLCRKCICWPDESVDSAGRELFAPSAAARFSNGYWIALPEHGWNRCQRIHFQPLKMWMLSCGNSCQLSKRASTGVKSKRETNCR